MNITNKYVSLSVMLAVTVYLAMGNPAAKAEQKLTVVPSQDERQSDDPLQLLIAQHLEAVKERNADQAFSFFAHSLHDKFNDAGKFLVSLRLEYRPIYNYKRFSFLDQRFIDQNTAIQTVNIEDRYGYSVTVLYKIKSDQLGRWLIDSFTVLNGREDSQPI